MTNATGPTATLSAKIASFGTGTINMAPYSLNNASDAASEFSGITLWLDAADASTIVTGTGNEVNTWANKIDTTVKMHSHSTYKPDTGASINTWMPKRTVPPIGHRPLRTEPFLEKFKIW